jgi:hypothetical protein
MDLRDICRVFQTLHTTQILFSAAYDMSYKVGHILGHKTIFRKCKNIEITP